MNERDFINKKKVEYFFQNRIIVHVTKNNNYFHNGLILEIEGDLFILEDEINGAMPIYFFEVKEIEKRKEKR